MASGGVGLRATSDASISEVIISDRSEVESTSFYGAEGSGLDGAGVLRIPHSFARKIALGEISPFREDTEMPFAPSCCGLAESVSRSAAVFDQSVATALRYESQPSGFSDFHVTCLKVSFGRP